MKVPRYDYASQFAEELPAILTQIEAMLQEGRYILTAEVEAFERTFAHYLSCEFACAVKSGTDALILALQSCGIGAGDEVITHANTFHATVAAICLVGATPVLVDARDDSFLIDVDAIEDRITPRTRAILPVHLYGKPTPMARLMELAKEYNLDVIEDAAQAHGAKIEGRRVGTFGRAGCFSFHPSKNLAAAGDGGAVVTNDARVVEQLRLRRALGQKSQNEHVVIGYNSKLDAIQALIVLRKLAHLDTWNAQRRHIAAQYRRLLAELPVTFQQMDEGEEHVYHLFQIRTLRRDALLKHLAAAGVDCVIRYPTPIHLQSAFSQFNWRPGQFPVAERLAQELLCLPIRPNMPPAEIEYVVDVTRDFFRGARMTPLALCVLGGSSAFAAGLIDALRDSRGELGELRLSLYGRDAERLELMRRYAQRQLAAFRPHVVATCDVDRALEGANVVLHQIRYGGLEFRRLSERLCAEWQVPADETLGPAATLTALSSLPGLSTTCAAIRRCCPTAWVVNLTNPLSSVTALMAAFGVPRTVGVCELPLVTQRAVAAQLHVADERLAWAYTGLNHRGFLHDLRVDSIDVLPELIRTLGDHRIAGIAADDIRDLQAVPLKYFSLLTGSAPSSPDRAGYLLDLQTRIAVELTSSCDASPTSLRERNQDWYPLAVAPLLAALVSPRPSRHVVNVPSGEGIVIEAFADVGAGEIRIVRGPAPPEPARRWLTRFERHERSFVDALLNPTQQSILAALACDPVVPQQHVDTIANEIWRRVEKSVSDCVTGCSA